MSQYVLDENDFRTIFNARDQPEFVTDIEHRLIPHDTRRAEGLLYLGWILPVCRLKYILPCVQRILRFRMITGELGYLFLASDPHSCKYPILGSSSSNEVCVSVWNRGGGTRGFTWTPFGPLRTRRSWSHRLLCRQPSHAPSRF